MCQPRGTGIACKLPCGDSEIPKQSLLKRCSGGWFLVSRLKKGSFNARFLDFLCRNHLKGLIKMHIPGPIPDPLSQKPHDQGLGHSVLTSKPGQFLSTKQFGKHCRGKSSIWIRAALPKAWYSLEVCHLVYVNCI